MHTTKELKSKIQNNAFTFNLKITQGVILFLMVFLLAFQNLTAQSVSQLSVNDEIIFTDCIDVALIDSTASLPSIYSPVCGCDGVTYDNEQIAQTYFGLTSWTDGSCSCELEVFITNEYFSCYNNYVCLATEGGTAPFTFYLTNNDIVATSDSGEFCWDVLEPGVYEAKVEDAQGCISTLTFDVPEYGFEVIGNVENVSCAGAQDGSITIDVIGGEAPYTVFWEAVNGTTNPNLNLNNLSAGEYTVFVYDANQCLATATFVVNEPAPLEVSFEITSGGCDDEVDGCLTVEGGTMPYEIYVFSLIQFDGVLPAVDVTPNNDPTVANASIANEVEFESTTPNDFQRCANNIPAGHYLVVVVDENGCYDILYVFIPEANPLSTEFEITNEDCEGVDGCLFIEGGTKPYQLYVFTCPDPTTTIGTPQISAAGDVSIDGMVATNEVDIISDGYYENEICAENIPAGVYYVLVVDANQCWSYEVVEIEATVALETSFEITSDVCDDQVDGCLTVEGGTMPYNIHVFKLDQFDGTLPAVDVNPNNIPTVANAVVTDDVNFENTNTSDFQRCANNIPSGHYLVVVIDENGCYDILHVFIPEANPLSTEFEIINEDCEGIDGCLFIEGGTKPYQLYVFTCPDPTPTLGTPQISAAGDVNVDGMVATTDVDIISNGYYENEICAENIPAGVYYVLVVDANQCWSYEVVEIAPTFGLEITGEVKNVSCNNTKTGAIDITVTGGDEPYFYQWSNGATTEDLENLVAGTYTVEVYTTNDFCTATATFEVLEFDALELNFTFDQYGEFACVDPVGGAAPYSIVWMNLASGNTATDPNFCMENIPVGTYLVEVTDANGCAASEIFFIKEKPCQAGEVYLEPNVINSGESTTFILENWSGLSLQWQFRTADTDWLIIPGATEEIYETPNINVGCDKEILVRAIVTCEDGMTLISETAILEVIGDSYFQVLDPKNIDPNLMDEEVMNARLNGAKNIYQQDIYEREIDAKVFPTTTQSDLNISFDFESEAVTTLRIVDLSGNVFWTKEMNQVDESTIENLQVNNLSNGRYFLHIENEGKVVTRSFFIEK